MVCFPLTKLRPKIILEGVFVFSAPDKKDVSILLGWPPVCVFY